MNRVPVAWRAYRVVNGCPKGARMPWPEPRFTAACMGHRAPQPHCECGIYGSYWMYLAAEAAIDPAIFTVCRPSGLVIPYTEGWRAERVDVVCAWAAPEIARRVQAEYPAWADVEWRPVRELARPRVYFQGAVLPGADLRGANLRGAVIAWADLTGADLRGADLRDAYAENVVLRGADLRGADLRGAFLPGAKLEGASLRGALTDDQFHCYVRR